MGIGKKIKKDFMTNKVNKNELIREIAVLSGFTIKDTKELLTVAIYVIKKHLYNYEEVSWSGFGRFGLKVIEAHTCRAINSDSETIEVEARRYPTFKASGKLKDQLNSDTFDVEDIPK